MRKLLLLILVLAVYGCGGDKDKEDSADQPSESTAAIVTGDTSVIMPLTIGNRWVYQASYLDTLANELVPARIDTFEVTGDTLIDGDRWFFVTEMIPEGGRAINRVDGFWQFRPGQEPFLFIKYPASEGDEYETVIGGMNVRNRVTGTDLMMTVPAGTFTCYKYTHFVDGQNLVVDFYFQPGVGGVRMEVYTGVGLEPVTRSDLIGYELK